MLKLEKNSILANSLRTSKSAEILLCILNFLHPAICTKRACVAITHKRSLFCVITWNDTQKPLIQCVNAFYIDKKSLTQRSYLLPWCIYCCLRSNIQPLESWTYIIVTTWVLILPSKPQPRNFFCPTSTKNLNKSPPRQTKSPDNSNTLNMFINNNTYTNFKIAYKHMLILQWCHARGLFGSQIPVTTGGFELQISCIRSIYLSH